MKRPSLSNFIEKRIKHFAAKYSFAFVLLLSMLAVSHTHANNLNVANVTYDLTASTVTFDLSWDHSWRTTSAIPNNWDAAWVFVKFRDCLGTNALAFTHGLVSTITSDHNFNVLAGAITYEPTTRAGVVGIDASPNNTGVMLRNAADPATGTLSARVTLKLLNLPGPGTTLDMRVFGVEMVYVPQAPYMLGDSSTNTSIFCVQTTRRGSVYVNSESALTAFEYTSATTCGASCAMLAGFPKGYNAYFIMKYEITQGQYCDFLNASNSTVQIAHFTYQNTPLTGGPPWSWQYRHTIRDTGNVFLNAVLGTERGPFIHSVGGVSKADRACNFLAWADVSTYLDWAALRPLTELEYEKACRGTLLPVPNEYAWGNTTGTQALNISGVENGTETITTASANINATGVAFTGTGSDLNSGPLRVGIFATGTSTSRQAAGMSYWGALDLSGNVMEYYISAQAGVSGGVSASGVSLGDGNLGDNGSHNQSNWPDAIATSPANTIIRRGGGWGQGTGTPCSVSYRQNGTTLTRDPYMGGRGGR